MEVFKLIFLTKKCNKYMEITVEELIQAYLSGYKAGEEKHMAMVTTDCIDKNDVRECVAEPAPEIDDVTSQQINNHFTEVPLCFAHAGRLYHLSDIEVNRAKEFMRMTSENEKVHKLAIYGIAPTFSWITYSEGSIGITLIIKCNVTGEQANITDYSKWKNWK